MSTGKLMSAGVVSAIAASLCCITPVLALIAGSGSIAASFSWIEPARPYLIGLTIAVLGFAWYQKLKPISVDECGCAVDEKSKFFQSKTFLLLITVFAILMVTFPVYSKIFFSNAKKDAITFEKSNTQTVELRIKGMTCEACEEHVSHEVNKLPGIIRATVSYEKKNALVQFDASKISVAKIIDAVHKTGYKVLTHSFKN